MFYIFAVMIMVLLMGISYLADVFGLTIEGDLAGSAGSLADSTDLIDYFLAINSMSIQGNYELMTYVFWVLEAVAVLLVIAGIVRGLS